MIQKKYMIYLVMIKRKRKNKKDIVKLANYKTKF